MSQLPYIGQSQKDEHEKEINAKRSLMIGYDSDNLAYNKLKVNSDGGASVYQENHICTDNTTTTALGANANVLVAYE